jgi:hypothetical protein
VTDTLVPVTLVDGFEPCVSESDLAAAPLLLTELQNALAAGPLQETNMMPNATTRRRFQAPMLTRSE